MYLYVQDVGLIKWIIILMFHHYWHPEGRNILQLEFLTLCVVVVNYMCTHILLCVQCITVSLSHTHTYTHLARTNYSFQPIMHVCVCVCVCFRKIYMFMYYSYLKCCYGDHDTWPVSDSCVNHAYIRGLNKVGTVHVT